MGEFYTEIGVHTFEYKWRIENFGTFLELAEQEEKLNIDSPTFARTDSDDIKWHLKLHLHGKRHKYKDYISLFIECENIDNEKGITASQVYFLVDSNEKRIKIRDAGFRKFKLSDPDWGFMEFYRTEKLLKHEDSYLPNGELTIICQIGIMGDATERTTNSHESNTSRDNLADIYERLFMNDHFKDVTFLLGDKKIHAHKAILAIRSRVFAAMFRHDMKERNEHVVHIDDIDYEIFEALLRYIYINDLSELDNIAMELLPAADEYELEELKESCRESLEKNITVENAAEVFVIADRHCVDKLMKSTREYIYKHMSDVMETSGYRIMEKEHPKLIVNLFRDFAVAHQKDLSIMNIETNK